MGNVKTINYNKFPKQGDYVGQRVQVLYHYAEPPSGERPQGSVVRDDMEEPFITIFCMDDGRYLLATECQYSFVKDS
jgi:hypothetical protein